MGNYNNKSSTTKGLLASYKRVLQNIWPTNKYNYRPPRLDVPPT